MKKIFLTLALITAISVNLKSETLRFITKNGLELSLPIKKEKEEMVPEHITKITAYQIFDLTKITKPEKEEDIPDFIKKMKTNIPQ